MTEATVTLPRFNVIRRRAHGSAACDGCGIRADVHGVARRRVADGRAAAPRHKKGVIPETGQRLPSSLAESERFELSIQVSPYTRFPGVLLQPLGQLSNA